MKMTVICESYEHARKRLQRLWLVLVLAVCAALALNVLFLALRSDENHSIMLVLSIAVDVICGWFFIAFYDLKLAPLARLMALSKRPVRKYSGVIEAINTEITRVEKFDCITVTVSGRNVFLPEALSPDFEIGKAVSLSLSGMIVTEVEYK